MNVRLLGAHNGESEKTRLVTLLIDDILALDAGGLTSGLSFPAQRRLKAILLTHQHYDHIRDVPAIAMNLYLAGATINIYSILSVYEMLTEHLMDSNLYPNFFERPPGKPTLQFTVVKPDETEQIEGYRLRAIPVSHAVPAVGYQITATDGKVVFYTGDTGPGLTDGWRRVSPQLLLIEVTASSRFDQFARENGHLTPNLLKQELRHFREIKGYLPQVVTLHMSPGLEGEIAAEIATVARELNHPITLGYEGMELRL